MENNLYNILNKYNIESAIEIEKTDRQFLALEKLFLEINSGYPQGVPLQVLSNYLFSIIANALICYQLSGKGEDYWEEFGKQISPLLTSPQGRGIKGFSEIYSFFEKFIPESKNNKRFINIKLKRILKLEKFYNNFLENYEYYYNNMDKLVLDLSKIMKQKKEAKTIVFAVKMFSYGARNIFGIKYFPENIMIPIDSRLENLYKKYSLSTEGFNPLQIKNFYIELSKKLKIPLLHLDAILWVNYDELINI